MNINKKQIEELKVFIDACKADHSILDDPELDFFKKFIADYSKGGFTSNEKTPSGNADSSKRPNSSFDENFGNISDSESESESSSSDSDIIDETVEPQVEEDDEVDSEIISVESDPLPTYPCDSDPTEVADENLDKASDLTSEANNLFSDGKYNECIDLYTQVLKLGSISAMIYSKRANCYLKLNKPNSCISDCTKALEINPSNARSCKLRGKAYRLIGKYVEAHKDLELGQKLDYDDDLWELQKFVSAKYNTIRSREMKREQNAKDIEMKKRQKEIKRRKKKAMKEYEEEKKRQASGMPGMPGGMGGMGGMPGGMPGMPGGMGGMPGGMGGMPGGMGGMPGMPGGMGGMGGMPGGMGGGMPGGMGGMPGGMGGGMPGGMGGGMPGGMGGGMPGGMGGLGDLGSLYNNPELMKMFENPKLSAAMKDMATDPSKYAKYMNDPEIKEAMNNLQQQFGGAAPGA